MNKWLQIIWFLIVPFNSIAQRQKEILDFEGKWELSVLDIQSLEINSLPGKLVVTGVDDQKLNIDVSGEDVDQLQGGATGLGLMVSKNRIGNYRIQGIVDPSRNYDVTYTISIPTSTTLRIQSGSQYKNSNSWTINNMKTEIELEKISGDVSIINASGPTSIICQNGSVKAHFSNFQTKKPSSIAATGNISLSLPKSFSAVFDLHLYKDTIVESQFTFNKMERGTKLFDIGNYTFQMGETGAEIDLHVYSGTLRFKSSEQ